MHVLRKSDGTGGHSYQDVQSTLNILNSDFNPHGIYFAWNGTIDYIDNTNSYYYPTTLLFYINNHFNGIDIYLTPDDVEDDYEGGAAHYPWDGLELLLGGMFSETFSYVPSHVITHEVGHLLYLVHTHYGTDTNEGGGCQELVDGSNSDCCGDCIEDTPADPNLEFDVDTLTYQWRKSGYDQNGDPYAPDTRQFMSYTHPRCLEHFSQLQVERMRAAIESQSELQAVLMPFVDGPNVPCGEETYKVESLPNDCYTVWSWKGDTSLPIVQGPSSANQCTITNSTHPYINDTLVATVYKNGNVVHTLEKAINTGCNFSGTYQQAAHNYNTWNFAGQTATSFYDGDTFGVYKGTKITLRSNKFIGATITHSGASPFNWTHSGDSVTFNFRYFQPGNPILQSRDHPIAGSMTVDVIDNNTCEHSRFTIVGHDPINPVASVPNIQMSRQGQYLTFSRSTEDTDASMAQEANTNGEWTLTITNLATGQTMYQGGTDANKREVNVRDWPAGIYVATIQMGNYSTNIKFKL